MRETYDVGKIGKDRERHLAKSKKESKCDRAELPSWPKPSQQSQPSQPSPDSKYPLLTYRPGASQSWNVTAHSEVL